MKAIIIAAVSRNMAIGKDGLIPWYLPEDLRLFNAETKEHAVVMGRRTFESLPLNVRPLPHRYNLVVTRTMPFMAGVQRCQKLQHAITMAEARGHTKLFIAGGQEIYAEALPLADELILTCVDQVVPYPDAVFPSYDSIAAAGYTPVERSAMMYSSLGVKYRTERYERCR